MTIVLAASSFILGVYLSMRTVAALYRVIDLWYALAREWLRIARGILGWLGATAIAGVLMDHEAFLWGCVCYAVAFAAFSLSSHFWFYFHVRE
ncbi:MAG TPA: hypothetical protein VKB93_16785 [Thermoanaerobaculia bacterium]|nr:hypothetical protein [Thermoanaerobaculia bacterium]